MDIQLKNDEIIKWAGLSPDVYSDLTTLTGDEFVAVKNKFLSALINKISATKIDRAYIVNPFKKYDSFDIPYGETIENIFVDIPMGYDYDDTKAGENLLKQARPSVEVNYATLNYEKQYKITVKDAQIRRAVRNEYGLQSLVSYLVESLGNASALDEYYAQIAVFSGNEGLFKGGYQTITSKTADVGKDLTAKIVEEYNSLTLPTASKNAIGVINPSTKSDLILVIKQDLLNKINLDFLSGVFNLSKVDLIDKIIPVASFKVPVYNVEGQTTEEKGEDLAFAIIDTRGIDNHVALNSAGLFYNPEGLYTNHYRNLWKVYGFKKWYNAVAYKLTISE